MAAFAPVGKGLFSQLPCRWLIVHHGKSGFQIFHRCSPFRRGWPANGVLIAEKANYLDSLTPHPPAINTAPACSSGRRVRFTMSVDTLAFPPTPSRRHEAVRRSPAPAWGEGSCPWGHANSRRPAAQSHHLPIHPPHHAPRQVHEGRVQDGQGHPHAIGAQNIGIEQRVPAHGFGGEDDPGQDGEDHVIDQG